MDYIRFAITNPVKVSVGVILIVLAGLLALEAIPIQLTPDVETPTIKVETNWIGANPEEVEKEIIQEQEKFLQGLQNLTKMTATAHEGRGEIVLEFTIATNINHARQEVSDKLREVPEYPPDADEPVITAADASDANAIAWIVLTSEDPDFNVQGFFDTADRRVKPLLERVKGIAQVNIFGGREREVHIRIHPQKLAFHGITFNQLMQALQLDNINVSAGQISDGQYDVRVRTVNQYDNLEMIRETVVQYTEGGPVRIRDLGDVVLTYEKQRAFVRSRGEQALALQVVREVGSNVMQTMRGEGGIHETIEHINAHVLPDLGPGLKLTQVYDETTYIDEAISLVQQNMVLGGILAIIIMSLFLRTFRPTMVIALAIPISIIGTFVVMTLLGRNINVISLAGLTFAVGMVVDNAIVVLENIDRHLNMGKHPLQAAYDGAKEVWGAILASTLTTLVVFLPVIFMQEEAGQLFRDISIAICAAVSLSLFASVTVIPSASARWLRQRTDDRKKVHEHFKNLFGLAPVLDKGARGVADIVYKLSAPNTWGVASRLGVVALFTVLALVGAAVLMPPSTYLPNGNRNLVFGMMFTPPGYNLDQNEYIGNRVESQLRPFWEAQTMEEAEQKPRPTSLAGEQGIPPIENYFFVSFGGNIFMGGSSKVNGVVRPLEGLMTAAMMDTVPGAFGIAKQRSIFARGLSSGNSIDVELKGTDLDQLRDSGDALYHALAAEFGYQNLQTDPLNIKLAARELQIRPNPILAQHNGVDTSAMGVAVAALVDGVQIGDYREQGETIDLRLIRHPDYPLSVETLTSVPMATRLPDGTPDTPIDLASVVDADYFESPQQINRIERMRAIRIIVIPPNELPLETVESRINEIVEAMRTDNQLPSSIDVQMAGTADKLVQVRRTLLGDMSGTLWESIKSLLFSRIFLAFVVVYLVMAALFESFLYPFVIMFAVPLATVGGFAGLRLVHMFDPLQLMDVLTMLGFVILIGVVVNNAILLVHQALNFMRGISDTADHRHEIMKPREAIRESVRTRIRPIFMTTSTSVFGMLPLVLMPGSGSELYRGLGSVVIGGLVVASVFTLLVVPLLFSLVIDLKLAVVRLMGGDVEASLGIKPRIEESHG